MTDTPPLLWALDISKSRTSLVEGRAGETPHAVSIVGAKMDVEEASEQLYLYLVQRRKLARPDWLFYEAPLASGMSRPDIDWDKQEWHYSRNPQTGIDLAEIVGVVKLFARLAGIPKRAVHVQTVRKEFLGHGRFSQKNEGKRRAKAMCDLLGWKVNNLDDADGMAVWHYGTTIVAKKYARAILPSMHARVATTVAGVDVEQALFRRTAWPIPH